MRGVELRIGWRWERVKVRFWSRMMEGPMVGSGSEPFGGAYLSMKWLFYELSTRRKTTHVHPEGRNPTTFVYICFHLSKYSVNLSDVMIPRGTTCKDD